MFPFYQVYKQKTELAKREYLKQLAAYRAAKVSNFAESWSNFTKISHKP